MPVRLQTLDRGLGLWLQALGAVSVDEILEVLDFPEETLRKARYGIVDFTQVENLNLSGEDIRQIVAKDRYNARTNPDMVLAMIAPEDLTFGLSRMYSMLSESGGWAADVFRTREDAEAWLYENVDPGLMFEADDPPEESWE